jgi:hypothetical protein
LFENKIPKPAIGENLKDETYYPLLTKVGKIVDDMMLNFYEDVVYKQFPEKRILYNYKSVAEPFTLHRCD